MEFQTNLVFLTAASCPRKGFYTHTPKKFGPEMLSKKPNQKMPNAISNMQTQSIWVIVCALNKLDAHFLTKKPNQVLTNATSSIWTNSIRLIVFTLKSLTHTFSKQVQIEFYQMQYPTYEQTAFG